MPVLNIAIKYSGLTITLYFPHLKLTKILVAAIISIFKQVIKPDQ